MLSDSIAGLAPPLSSKTGVGEVKAGIAKWGLLGDGPLGAAANIIVTIFKNDSEGIILLFFAAIF